MLPVPTSRPMLLMRLGTGCIENGDVESESSMEKIIKGAFFLERQNISNQLSKLMNCLFTTNNTSCIVLYEYVLFHVDFDLSTIKSIYRD